MRITFILGTKAEFLRLFPLMHYLQEEGEPYDIIHTCQHDLGDYLHRFRVKPADFLDFPEFRNTEVSLKDIDVGFSLYRKLMKALKARDPKVVVYQGDTFSTGIASLACSRGKFFSAHVEAGFRSGSWKEPFPEELIRKMGDRRADLLFAPSETAWANLMRENVKGQVMMSGSTGRDAVDYVLPLPNEKPPGDYAVLTMHRYENLFSGQRLKKIIEILGFVTVPIVWPMHEHTREKLESYGMMDMLQGIKIIPPMEYAEFMGLVAGSKYTITDGNCLEEESIILGRKSLLLRKRNERKESLALKLSFLTSLNVSTAATQLKAIEENPGCDPSLNPYYLGRSASQIIGDRLLAD